MFNVKENGKVYRVEVRGSYQHTIRSERKLREVVDRSYDRTFGAGQAAKHTLFDKCSTLGILSYKCPVNR